MPDHLFIIEESTDLKNWISIPAKDKSQRSSRVQNEDLSEIVEMSVSNIDTTKSFFFRIRVNDE